MPFKILNKIVLSIPSFVWSALLLLICIFFIMSFPLFWWFARTGVPELLLHKGGLSFFKKFQKYKFTDWLDRSLPSVENRSLQCLKWHRFDNRTTQRNLHDILLCLPKDTENRLNCICTACDFLYSNCLVIFYN